MPANDEFPRGWTLSSSGGSGATLTIVIPAVVGIVHVLTDVRAKIVNRSGAAFSANINVNGSFLFTMDLVATATGDADSASGIRVLSTIGGSLTVAFSAGAVNVFEYLSIQGYDI